MTRNVTEVLLLTLLRDASRERPRRLVSLDLVYRDRGATSTDTLSTRHTDTV